LHVARRCERSIGPREPSRACARRPGRMLQEQPRRRTARQPAHGSAGGGADPRSLWSERCTSSPPLIDAAHYRKPMEYPAGFIDCQRHASRHISSRPRVARQPIRGLPATDRPSRRRCRLRGAA
jgi:hypothetical protein